MSDSSARASTAPQGPSVPGPPRSGPWTLVLPVKGGPAAKSRLGAPPELAAAIAADSLEVVASCPVVGRVVVVTSDAAAGAMARAAGADVVHERHPGSGLAGAIRDGLRAAAERPGPVAVLLADVPAARPEDLGRALGAADRMLTGRPAPPMALLPDTEGTGTVLLAALRADALDPAFGPGSAAEHVRRGARSLDLDLPRLRRDVDTPGDLQSALDLGCGPRTSRAAADTSRAAADSFRCPA